MKFVPREDRVQLDVEHDAKKRIQLSIKLAEARLSRAEQLTVEEQFDRVTNELGNYQGLVDDALKFLATLPSKKDKTRDTNKRLELALRPHISRLETMRRATPSAYGKNFKMMIEYVRSARDQALNSFYDDTVLRGDAAGPENNKTEAPLKSKDEVDNARTTKVKPDEHH
jgi:hypothetical protein